MAGQLTDSEAPESASSARSASPRSSDSASQLPGQYLGIALPVGGDGGAYRGELGHLLRR